MNSIAEIKLQANITQVWAALGGGKLRGNRGQAFWRDGDGYNVALYPQTGTWRDFVAGDGGDVVALVRTVRQCDFLAAAQWLADFTGMPALKAGSNATSFSHYDTDWAADLRRATWWAEAAEIMAEFVLEELSPNNPERFGLTQLLKAVRLGDASTVAEYRAWRARDPRMTAGLERAGRLHDASVQRKLARWLRRYLDGSQAT
jgi:hypothetical protein